MSSLVRSTGIVALSTLISRIMGYVRDMMMASFFGATGATDAFYVAFRIPNLLRRLVAEGAFTISFIPVYTEYLITKGEDEALALAQKTLSILVLILVMLVGLGEIFSPGIVSLFAIGFKNPGMIDLAVALNRIMFPYLFFVALVAFAMGVLNSHKYFFAPSFAPVLLNAGIIIGILLSSFFREPLYGVSFGILFGGLLQILLQIPYMVKSGFKLKISIDFRHPGIRRIFSLILPAMFGTAVYLFNQLMSTMLASLKQEGSVTYLYYSDRMNEIVLGIFIVSIGNVILPEMSKLTATDNLAKLKKLYTSSVRAALFLSIPASAALMAIGFPIISVMFMRGRFTAADAAITSGVLFFASMGIASISVLRITTPTFYSMKDTKTPVIAAFISFVLNISAGYYLMNTYLGIAGLALANTVSSTVQMLMLLSVLQRRIGKIQFSEIIAPCAKFILAASVMAIALVYFSGFIDWENAAFTKRIAVLIMLVSGGGIAYFFICLLLGAGEARYVLKKVLKR